MLYEVITGTHGHLYAGSGHAGPDAPSGPGEGDAAGHVVWSRTRAFVVLLVSAGFVGWMSEVLVGGAEEAARSLGMSDVFVGVIISYNFV